MSAGSRFDRTADRYAAMAMEKDWAGFVEWCDPRPEDRALDVAGGPGALAAVLQPLVGSMTVLDTSARLLEFVPDGVARALGRAEQLPFDDATFDLVTAVETHYYWPDLPRDLAEVRRVLKPGGSAVLIAEVYRHPGSAIETAALKLMSGATLSPEQHREALEAAGFGDVQVDTNGRWIRAIGRNVVRPGAAPAGARRTSEPAGLPA